jgi:hypothetical protein
VTIQRCGHLKPEGIGTLRSQYGIRMELCEECNAEMDHRLSEKPLSGETPIERAAEQGATEKTGGGIR